MQILKSDIRIQQRGSETDVWIMPLSLQKMKKCNDDPNKQNN